MEQNNHSMAYIMEEAEAKRIFAGRFDGDSCHKAFPDQLHTFIGDCSSEPQIVVVVPQGDVRFPSNSYDAMNIIVVVGESVSADYLEYLEDMQISYVFAGFDGKDRAELAIRLKHDFGIMQLRHYHEETAGKVAF